MPLFIDTSGRATVGIGICGRCSMKFSLEDLAPDPNYPGLMVCRDDRDDYDPYRLPPRETESITLMMPRPDVPLQTTSVAPGGPSWPVSQFPDDGLQALQQPADGANYFSNTGTQVILLISDSGVSLNSDSGISLQAL